MGDERLTETGDGDEVAWTPPRRRIPWAMVTFVALVVVGALAAYVLVEQRGPSVRGAGHVVVLQKAGAWAFLLDGTLLPITAESAARLQVRTAPCDRISGTLEGEWLELDALDCRPGDSIQTQIGERLRRLSLRFAYWDPAIESVGQTLEPHLEALEVVASMVDPRLDAPQLVPLYAPLFPGAVGRARQAGTPPPVIVQVKRHDFVQRRMGRTELASFLSQPRFVLAAGASKAGGWLTREVVLDTDIDGVASFVRLLVSPLEAPWPQLLQAPVIRVSSSALDADDPAHGSLP